MAAQAYRAGRLVAEEHVAEDDAWDAVATAVAMVGGPDWAPQRAMKDAERCFRRGSPVADLHPAELLAELQQPAPPRFEAIDFDDITLNTAATYLLKGVIEAGSLALAFGETGCGKTFVVLDISLHVALGWDWRDRKVRKAGVIYIAAEGGVGVVKRLAAFRQYHKNIPLGVPFVLIPTQSIS